MKNRKIFVITILVFFISLIAQETITKNNLSNIVEIDENVYQVTETALIEDNMTPRKARAFAFEKCQHHAVGKHSGYWVESTQMVRESEYDNSENSVHSKYGSVKSKAKILNREIIEENFFIENNQIFVTLTAEIEVCDINYNPDYNIEVKTNRSIFEEGDELKLDITSSKNCYITLFMISPDDSLYVIFPLKENQDNQLKRNRKLTLPPQRHRYSMLLENDVTSQIDLLKIVATKKYYNFYEFGKKTEHGNLKINFQYVSDWINNIPDDEIVEKDIPITVYKATDNQ